MSFVGVIVAVLTAAGLAPLGLEVKSWAAEDAANGHASSHVEIIAGAGTENAAGTIPNV